MKTDPSAPLTTSTTIDFARENADRLLEHLKVQIARATTAAGADEVHDLRVAIRRFNAVLKALKLCFPARETQKIRLTLKRVMTLAGNVRDRDIGVALLSKVSGAAAAPFVIRLEAERAEAEKELKEALESLQRTDISARWHKMLCKAGKPTRRVEKFRLCPVEVTAVRLLPDIADKHFKRGEGAAEATTSARQLHRFRIATKKYRYTLDLFSPLYGESMGKLLGELKGIQTLLGDINDYETLRHMVRDVKPRTGDALTISAGIAAKMDEKAAAFRDHWSKTFTEGKVRQWKVDLQQVGLEAVKSVGNEIARIPSRSPRRRRLPSGPRAKSVA